MWQQFQLQSNRLAVMRRYHAVLTHTAHMRAEMARHGVAADVVPYPVATRPAEETAPVGGDSNGELRLLFAGRMDSLKGGRYLIDALPQVAAAVGRPVSATFAGDGQQREALQARALELHGPNVSCRFVGWISQERIGNLMRASDLLVVPSVWPEPFGSVGPAAAQHGVPAAAFDVGGIREWLTDGVTGHLAPGHPPTAAGLARAIVRCVENADHYAALQAGARTMADRFTMDRHLPVLMRALEQAAGRPSSTRQTA
jgi:glycosyltransferase involved in cell wall biosynthesis